ncbi:phage major tail tube protein [Acinetobacter populi]|uniref:Phage major tail tube protein n=1 Tax=Acinetobacter populi TaxID=1582270 RepID=A0A1Z9Z2K9_9GAMM|nr:phage major tail tube protein [Acinetobacter populi]OUY08713.1 phage major tail tube protein [Acinetobacter populi]
MALPSKLKNLNLFNDAESLLGQVATVTLPKLQRKLEDWRGGGMDGNVKIDLGAGDDGLQLEWTIGGLDLTSIRQFGGSISSVQLRFAGAYQRDDTGTVDAVEVVMRGRHEEIDMGEQKAGDDTEQKMVTHCTYYKLTVNGRVEVEIDVLNMKYIVNGVDILAEQRKALGM